MDELAKDKAFSGNVGGKRHKHIEAFEI